MTTLSTFRINQPPGTPGPAWDRSRRDIDPYSLGSESVECEALEKSQTSYLWEIVSAPPDKTIVVTGDTTHTCSFNLEDRDGYMVRLTVNEGLPNESITTLYIGVPMANTGLCLPAAFETNQDNSQDPYTGERGHADKVMDSLHKVDEVSEADGIGVDNSGWTKILAGQTDVQGAFDALDIAKLGDYSSVYDPASYTVSLLASQSGCLHNTENSTGGKSTPHVVTLPTPAVGLNYTVALAIDVPLMVQVDDAGTETLIVPSFTVISTSTKIQITSGLVKFVAISSTQWIMIIGGGVTLDPDGEATEIELAEGQFTSTAGGGDSHNPIITIRDGENQSVIGSVEWGQQGVALGYGAEHIAGKALTRGTYARAREKWTNVHVSGSSYKAGEPGAAQTTSGCNWLGQSVNGVADVTGTFIESGVDGGIALEPETIFAFKGLVVARSPESLYSCKSWSYSLLVSVDSSGNATIVSKTITVEGESAYWDEASWSIDFAISSWGVYQDLLSLVCTGESGHTVTFHGSIQSSEINDYTPA